MRKYKLINKVIDKVEWCPNDQLCLLAVANEDKVHLIAPALFTRSANFATKDLLT